MAYLKKLLLLKLLVTLTLCGKQSERFYQEKFAREIGGQVEVVMKDGTRCDILTTTHAIEVDFAKKWAEFKLCYAYRKVTGSSSDRTLSIR